MSSEASEARTADSDVRARVRSIILQVSPNPDGVQAGETQLVEHLEYHSLALLELGFTLEDEFNLPPLDQAQVQDITTVEQIEDLVLGLLRPSTGKGAADSRD
jgi:acyl carrier protein